MVSPLPYGYLRKRIAAIKIIKKMQIIVTFSICEII